MFWGHRSRKVLVSGARDRILAPCGGSGESSPCPSSALLQSRTHSGGRGQRPPRAVALSLVSAPTDMRATWQGCTSRVGRPGPCKPAPALLTGPQPHPAPQAPRFPAPAQGPLLWPRLPGDPALGSPHPSRPQPCSAAPGDPRPAPGLWCLPRDVVRFWREKVVLLSGCHCTSVLWGCLQPRACACLLPRKEPCCLATIVRRPDCWAALPAPVSTPASRRGHRLGASHWDRALGGQEPRRQPRWAVRSRAGPGRLQRSGGREPSEKQPLGVRLREPPTLSPLLRHKAQATLKARGSASEPPEARSLWDSVLKGLCPGAGIAVLSH